MSITSNITKYEITSNGTVEKLIKSREIANIDLLFTSLTDAPSSYSGEAGKVVSVKSTEDGLEFSTVSGTGDMTKAVYDPNLIEADAFDQDNMTDGVTNKNYTATEKTKLSGIETGADVTDVTNVGSSIDGAGASSTIADTDKFASVVSGTLKTNLFSLIKSTLKTYFDGLYQTIGNYFDKTADTLDDISDGVIYVKSHNDYTTTEKNDVALNTSHRSNTSNPHATSDANLNLTDITTGNVSITKHGFAPKLPNDATKYLDGTGAYTVISKSFYETKSYTIQAEIKVASGDTDVIPPFEINLKSGQTCKIIKWSGAIGSGTSATLKLQKSDGIGGAFADITGFTAFVVSGGFTNPTSSDPTDVTLSDGEVIQPVVTAVSGTPTNLMLNIVLEYTI